jgi:hypothetical protein
VLEDNTVLISELIVLIQLLSSSVGVISYGKLILRLMSSACEVSLIKDELSSMSGIAIVQDTQRGVFVNVIKTNGAENSFGSLHSKLEAASKKNF